MRMGAWLGDVTLEIVGVDWVNGMMHCMNRFKRYSSEEQEKKSITVSKFLI